MIEIVDITDRDSLKAWLEGQPKEVSVWIARRAALRVFPFSWRLPATSDSGKKDYFAALQTLRSFLISEVARKMPTPEVVNAAQLTYISRFDPTNDIVSNTTEAVNATLITDVESDHVGYVGIPHSDKIIESAVKAATSSVSALLTGTINADAISAFWNSIRADCEAIATDADLDRQPLWADGNNPLAKKWEDLKQHLTVSGPHRSDETARGSVAVDWSFWVKWYGSVLAGEALNWDMLEKIALIKPAEWEKGPLHINNGVIAGIVEEFNTSGEKPGESIAVKSKRIDVIRQSVTRNQAAIPVQLDGLSAIISKEMERLRSINVMDELEAQNRDRQLEVFQNLADGIKALGDAVPLDTEPTKEDAEKIDGLLTVYANEFRKWPRDNAVDMVDSTVRVALVGMTAGLAVTFGAPVLAGVAIGGIAFGGKKLVGAAKSLKDSMGNE